MNAAMARESGGAAEYRRKLDRLKQSRSVGLTEWLFEIAESITRSSSSNHVSGSDLLS